MKYMNLQTFKTESYYISDILIKIKDEGMDEEVIKNDVSFKQFSQGVGTKLLTKGIFVI